jgi:hypothetical protein
MAGGGAHSGTEVSQWEGESRLCTRLTQLILCLTTAGRPCPTDLRAPQFSNPPPRQNTSHLEPEP